MRLASLPLLVALLAASPALAQSDQDGGAQLSPRDMLRPPQSTILVEPVGMMIAAFDADGDGKVTRAEFDAGLRHSFDAIDTAHTGSLSLIGYSDWALRWLGDANALPSPFEVDVDGDKRITFDELAHRFAQLFDRFDTDKDGVIVRSELLTMRMPAMNGPGRGRGGRRMRQRGQ